MRDIEKKLPTRKNTRLQVFDYNIPTAYFVTIGTVHKMPLLSNIVGGDVLDAPQSDVSYLPKRIELSYYGKIADKYINQLNDFYRNINVIKYVIMPNHIHLLLQIPDDESGRSGTPVPTVCEVPTVIFDNICFISFVQTVIIYSPGWL